MHKKRTFLPKVIVAENTTVTDMTDPRSIADAIQYLNPTLFVRLLDPDKMGRAMIISVQLWRVFLNVYKLPRKLVLPEGWYFIEGDRPDQLQLRNKHHTSGGAYFDITVMSRVRLKDLLGQFSRIYIPSVA